MSRYKPGNLAYRMPKDSSDVNQPRTQAVLAFVRSYKLSHDGNAPSVREICLGTGIGSTSVASWHIRKLEKAGLVEFRDGKLCLASGGKVIR